jgi:predicted ATPase
MLELKAASSEYISDRCFAFIATALGRMKRFDEGVRTIDEAFPFIERSGQRYYEAELHRLKGELLLAQDASNAAEAEQSLRTAIEIARKQHAKSWELRATTSVKAGQKVHQWPQRKHISLRVGGNGGLASGRERARGDLSLAIALSF